MGGGPSHWAAMDHIRAGFSVYATPDAARTFDDDLEGVASMGISVVSEDEAAGLRDIERVTLRDLWVDEVRTTLRLFGADDNRVAPEPCTEFGGEVAHGQDFVAADIDR